MTIRAPKWTFDIAGGEARSTYAHRAGPVRAGGIGTPDAVKTEFSRDGDQHQVAQLLQAGCTHMMQAFDIENFNLDDLIAIAMDDPQAIGG